MKLLQRISIFFRRSFCLLQVYVIKKDMAYCGKNLKVFGTPRMIAPWRISLGDNVALNDGCLLNATDSSIKIGNNVVISSDAKIMAASLDTNMFFLGIRKHFDKGGIEIGDNTWICAGAIVLPGVKIVGGGNYSCWSYCCQRC